MSRSPEPSERMPSLGGLTLAFRRFSGPLLAAGLVAFVLMGNGSGVDASMDIGFDFRGTLWEPARAVLYGGDVYAEPTREGVQIGNPSVYPPLVILLSVPLAVLPFATAAWIWWALLALAMPVALWILGVRDWRCFAVASLSPVVLQGLFFGNLTLALIVPIAVAWRYRDRPWVAGVAIGFTLAAKLFAWPLLLWLLVTRRLRAGAIATVTGSLLILLPWAAIGFEGLVDYPALLRVLQEVYGGVSLSLAAVAASLGAPSSVASAIATLAGLSLVAVAWWLFGRVDGDRRSFVAVVGACVIASPVVWQNYLALLFVPIALTWPRLAVPWFFGYAVWLAALLPKPTAASPEPCCRPPDVPEAIWIHSHATPSWGHAGGTMAAAFVVVVWCLSVVREAENEERAGFLARHRSRGRAALPSLRRPARL